MSSQFQESVDETMSQKSCSSPQKSKTHKKSCRAGSRFGVRNSIFDAFSLTEPVFDFPKSLVNVLSDGYINSYLFQAYDKALTREHP